MDKFKNKYRIPSARLQSWDYRNDGAYFITICTHERQHFFGEIVDGVMHLNEIGQLAENFWAEIPNHFPFVELGNFVIMPNHMHGILIIDKMERTDERKDERENERKDEREDECKDEREDECKDERTDERKDERTDERKDESKTTSPNEKMAKISPKSGSISVIIRSYKSVVSKHARLVNPDFAWQARFHDHIIRDAGSFDRIQHYIATNPENWMKDTFRA